MGEATAEWFASRVAQGVNYSDGWVDGFDEASPDTPLTMMRLNPVWWANGIRLVVE